MSTGSMSGTFAGFLPCSVGGRARARGGHYGDIFDDEADEPPWPTVLMRGLTDLHIQFTSKSPTQVFLVMVEDGPCRWPLPSRPAWTLGPLSAMPR